MIKYIIKSTYEDGKGTYYVATGGRVFNPCVIEEKRVSPDYLYSSERSAKQAIRSLKKSDAEIAKIGALIPTYEIVSISL